MQPYQVRRAAIILLGIVLVVFIAVQGVRWLGRLGSGGDNTPAPIETALIDYAQTNSSVRLTYTGPVEAREDYDQIRLTITPSQRRLEIVTGYESNVKKRQLLANDTQAYGVFLRALQINGFTSEQSNQYGDDERGVCFKGERIVGEIFESGQQTSRLWAASCSKKLGTMKAYWRDILRLFQDQFPEYKDFTKNVDI